MGEITRIRLEELSSK